MPSSDKVAPRLGLLSIVLLSAGATASPARASLQALATTGDALPGSPSAKFQGFANASINDAGHGAFVATLEQGVGGVTGVNDRAIIRAVGAVNSTLSQTGTGGLPGGGKLSAIRSASISNSGEVLVNGNAAAVEGLWRYPLGAPGIRVMSTDGVQGAGTSATVADLGFSAYQASEGMIAFHGDLATGGEASESTNHCIWSDSDGYQFLLAREGLSPVPDIDGVRFANISPTAVNNNHQVAMLGLLAVGPGGVNVGNSVGIWRMSPTQSKLIVRRQAGEVGGLSNASYSALGEPTMNDLGAIAFRGELAPSAEVNEANRYGIWLDYYLDTLPSNHIVALAGRPPVGLSSARFANFGDPLVNDNFRVLFTATLDPLIGGVSARDAQGIWSMWGQEGALLARTGSGGVPGVPGANFAGFGATALNNNDLAAVEATLAVGIGGVTYESAKGLWLMNPHGASTLVARTGDTLAGRTIADLTFTGGSGGSDGRPRSLNDSNQLIFTAQFTNGDEGVFLFTPSTELAPADFTGDGLVNAADLQRWRTNFGASPSALRSQGDADSDGDVDGSDLLTWQRQLGPGASASPVPEPGFIAVVLPGGMLGILRLNCGARSARRIRHR